MHVDPSFSVELVPVGYGPKIYISEPEGREGGEGGMEREGRKIIGG